MCPEAEFISRKRDNLLSRFEKIKEAHDEIQYIALKAYRRPAAGRMEILLHEVRNPFSLYNYDSQSDGRVSSYDRRQYYSIHYVIYSPKFFSGQMEALILHF